MKKLIFFIIFFSHINLYGQKPAIDLNSYNVSAWPFASSPAINSNGEYVSFMIINQPANSRTIVVKSTVNNWNMTIENGLSADFSKNGRYLVVQKYNDTVEVITLGTPIVKSFGNIARYNVVEKGGDLILIYLKKTHQLVIDNINKNVNKALENAIDYFFNKDAGYIILKTEERSTADSIVKLQCINLVNGSKNTFWSSSNSDIKIEKLIFSKDNKQIAGLLSNIHSPQAKNIFLYEVGKNKITTLFDGNRQAVDHNYTINSLERFNNRGDGIYLKLSKKETKKVDDNMVKVDVWSYNDPKLQSQQLLISNLQRDYLAIFSIANKQVLRLEGEMDHTISTTALNDDYGLIMEDGKGDAVNEWNWNKEAFVSVSIIDNRNGIRSTINSGVFNFLALQYRLSPDGRYVIYYDPLDANYYSYEVATKIKRAITKNIETKWTSLHNRDSYIGKIQPIGICSFVNKSSDVLIYDESDIWKIDMSCEHKPKNITNGYGKKNNIELRVATKLKAPNDELILSSFDRNNKDQGFFGITLDGLQNPTILTTQPNSFVGTNESENPDIFLPIKADNANKYIVRRMKASESPNFYITSDFKNFKQISSVTPENKFNWLTSELITWKSLDSGICQGILYKPENFDPNKKYPVIFYYYEKLSDNLNGYIMPPSTGGQINIPYFVSNNYLVFIPDLTFSTGEQSKNVYETLVSGAKFLGKLAFVDSTKMGLQGHSRGGYETNILITKTNIFSAACSASGFSDLISLYGGLRDSGAGRQSGFEILYQRIESTLWERPDLFIRNSPVFNADRVRTPLLMMNNIEDDDIPFMQGVEFFTALRRLGKTVWMLQYNGEGHVLFGKAEQDFTIRMKQFFDYYLMNKAAPKWMLDGIPARLKGKETGLELDTTGRRPSAGLLTPQAKQKADDLQNRKPIAVIF
jgi:hypothetical protein